MKKLAQRAMDKEFTVALPHILAVVLSLAAGAAQVVNQVFVNVSGSWHAYIGAGLAAVAYLGVKPLVGDQFREALPIPAKVSQAITGLVGAATVVAGQLDAAPAWVQPALAAAVTVLIGLGFGPAASPVADAAKRRRLARRREKAAALLGSIPAKPARKR